MTKKFAVFNPKLNMYFGRNYRLAIEPERIRLYNKRCYAQNSLNRRFRYSAAEKVDWEIVEVEVIFPTVPIEIDSTEVIENPIYFGQVVEYFLSAYKIDIMGKLAPTYIFSIDILAPIHASNRYLRSMRNGDVLVISEKTFESAKPLEGMIGNEILRMFGYVEGGKLIAKFIIDWM